MFTSISTNPTSIENIGFRLESITPYKRSMIFVEKDVETRKQKRGGLNEWIGWRAIPKVLN
jgi:hypothetical protein